jgi:hypothetical protein
MGKKVAVREKTPICGYFCWEYEASELQPALAVSLIVVMKTAGLLGSSFKLLKPAYNSGSWKILASA